MMTGHQHFPEKSIYRKGNYRPQAFVSSYPRTIVHIDGDAFFAS
jgi:hypothetical protein